MYMQCEIIAIFVIFSYGIFAFPPGKSTPSLTQSVDNLTVENMNQSEQ